jgi:PEP-CTERM motif
MIRHLLLASALGVSALAHANTVQTFYASGVFTDNTTFKGTYLIDTTAGTVQAADLFYLGQEYSNTTKQGPYSDADSYQVVTRVPSNPLMVLNLEIVGGNLQGFTDRPFCSVTNPCLSYTLPDFYASNTYNLNGDPVFLQSGSVTATPEPTSMALLGTGLLGGLGVIRRKLNR